MNIWNLFLRSSLAASLAIAHPCYSIGGSENNGEPCCDAVVVPPVSAATNTAPYGLTNPIPTSTTHPEGGSNADSTNQPQSGDLTYFKIGLGSCGEDHSGQDLSVNIVALSAQLMGKTAHGNPYCGRSITIKSEGRTAIAVVKDKCQACKLSDIDVSEKVFISLRGSLTEGRVHNVQWYFNN